MGLTDAELDRVVVEVSRGVMIENGREVSYETMPDRSAGAGAPSLEGLAEVALPDEAKRARERRHIAKFFKAARLLSEQPANS